MPPTPAFQLMNCIRDMPFARAMESHVSPDLASVNLLQLETRPAYVGSGVVMPLPALVFVLNALVVAVDNALVVVAALFLEAFVVDAR